MEGRIGRSRRLSVTAWDLVKRDRALLLLTVAGTLFGLLAMGLIFELSGLIGGSGSLRSRVMIAGAVLAWPTTFVTVFLQVAVAAAADAALRGGFLSVSEALGVARGRVWQILGWSALATGVGVLLSQIAERVPGGGRLASWALGAAWGLVTIFAVPVLALEGCGAPRCLRRSAGLLRSRWGEGVAGTVTIAAVFGLAVIVPGMVAGIGVALLRSAPLAGLIMLGLGLTAIMAISALSATVRQVFAVALYRYAEDGEPRGGFFERDLRYPFTRRRWGR